MLSAALQHAAQELHKEANQWDESQNSVVSLARTIAQMFNRMAEISEDPSKKRELIDLAKQIAEAAKVSNDGQVQNKYFAAAFR